MDQKEKYPYIRAWGTYMGSDATYIDRQKEEAEEENAPNDVYYKSSSDGWKRYSEAPTRVQKLLDDHL